FDPARSADGELDVPDPPVMSGRPGRPSDAVSTTVPDICGTPPALPAFAAAASSCAGVRSGRDGSPCTAAITGPVPTAAATTATVATGTPHLSARLRRIFDGIVTPPSYVSNVRRYRAWGTAPVPKLRQTENVLRRLQRHLRRPGQDGTSGEGGRE